jgi:hypothetical protein
MPAAQIERPLSGCVDLPRIARFSCLDGESDRELFGIGIGLARTRPLGIARHFFAGSQVLLYGVARQACPLGYLADGHLLAQGPTSDDTQCRHVYQS